MTTKPVLWIRRQRSRQKERQWSFVPLEINMAVTEARGRQPKSAVQPPESVKLTKSNASRADKTMHIKQKHVLTHFNQIKN